MNKQSREHVVDVASAFVACDKLAVAVDPGEDPLDDLPAICHTRSQGFCQVSRHQAGVE